IDSSVPRELMLRGIPFVLLTREVDGVAADAAVADNALGASLIAAENLRFGHRRIGAVFGPTNTSTGRDRLVARIEGRARAEARGVRFGPGIVTREPLGPGRLGRRARRERALLDGPRRECVVEEQQLD